MINLEAQARPRLVDIEIRRKTDPLITRANTVPEPVGEIDQARRVWAELKTINPKYSFSEHIGRLPFRKQADADRIAAGLSKAGLPD
ncbi:hypothetical protein [Bradyrhizobium japonicum]|uniref:hypothetical protein n=1 Tax=Bradyrhizobium japonicum TaxID=375 RepID=UPI003B67EE5B